MGMKRINIFGEMVRKLRKRNNWNILELANKLKYSKSMISHIEIGDREPSLDRIVLIAKTFNVSVDTLLGIDSAERDYDVLMVENKRLNKIISDIGMRVKERMR